MERVAEHHLPRAKACAYAMGVGIACGAVNAWLGIDIPLNLELAGWVIAAVVSVVILHEGIHGLTAVSLGSRPIFGIKPPLIFVTFREKVRRGRFLAVALAPLVILDAVFVVLYANDVLSLFSLLCLEINTIGAVGDVWIVLKLIGQPRGVWVQDTKSGIEIWRDSVE
jgi:hypothetical protein